MTRSRAGPSKPPDEDLPRAIEKALVRVRREAPAALLTSVSAILSRGSELADAAARKLSPPPSRQEQGTSASLPAIDADAPAATGGEAPADIGEPATAAPVPSDEAGHARTDERHITELADGNAASVVRQIPSLSTEELEQLLEYESAHRKRKTVLQAIERASAPSGRSRPRGQSKS